MTYCLEAQPTRKKPCLIHTKAIPQRLYLELKGQTQQPGRNPMNRRPRQSAQRSPRRIRPGKLRICAPSSTRQPSSELARPARSRSRASRRPTAPGRPGTSTGHSPTLLGSSTPGLSRDEFSTSAAARARTPSSSPAEESTPPAPTRPPHLSPARRPNPADGDYRHASSKEAKDNQDSSQFRPPIS